MIAYSFDYNVTVKTTVHIKNIDFTYHINTYDFPKLHTHNDYWEFTIITKGRLENHRNGTSELIDRNKLFISTTADQHYLKNINKKEDIIYINIMARESKIKELCNMFSSSFYEDILKGSQLYTLPNQFIERIIQTLQRVNSLPEEKWWDVNNIIKSLTISLLNFVYMASFGFNNSETKWVKKLNELEQKDEFLKYSVSDLGDNLGYSRTQLNRIFKEEFNTSPHDYLLSHKMNSAASLLAYSDNSVSTIASLLGYANLSQFNKNFKEKYKTTPKQYRLKIKR